MIIIDSHRFGPPPPPPSTVLRDAILADNPVAYFQLDEASGTTMINSAPGGANGTYANSPTLQGQTGLTTENKYHTVFNGASQYGYFAPSLSSPTALTLECWTILNGLPNGAGVMSNAFPSVVALEIGAGLASGGNVKNAGVYNGNWYTAGSGAYSTGVVYHIVGVHIGSSVLLYINGAHVATTAGTGVVPAPTATWYVGRRHDNATPPFWNGVIAHASLYTYALSAGQILAHYNASII